VNIHVKESDGDNAVHLAAYWNEDRSVARYLLDLGIDAHVPGECGHFALHGFARMGDIDMIVRMIEEGDSVNLAARKGVTALHLAAGKGHSEAVSELVRRGANVMARTDGDRTPLHYASTPETIEILVAAGADINAQSKWGDTPLHDAAHWCHAELCQKLVDLGADIEARARDGATPLLHSVKNKHRVGDVSAAIVLLNAGARLDAKDNRKSTIESLAKTRPELRRLLAAQKAHSAVLSVAKTASEIATKPGTCHR
jgi:ankyrin repeat protein